MTRSIFTAKVGTALTPAFGNAAEPNAAVAAVEAARAAAVALQPDPTAFAAALAVLVADGATPTQAHVTAVNSAYTTLAAAQTAYVAAVNAITTAAAAGSVSADMTLLVNGATVLTQNKGREIIRGFLQLLAGSSLLSGS